MSRTSACLSIIAITIAIPMGICPVQPICSRPEQETKQEIRPPKRRILSMSQRGPSDVCLGAYWYADSAMQYHFQQAVKQLSVSTAQIASSAGGCSLRTRSSAETTSPAFPLLFSMRHCRAEPFRPACRTGSESAPVLPAPPRRAYGRPRSSYFRSTRDRKTRRSRFYPA